MVFFLFSSATLPASSMISAVIYSRTPAKNTPADLEILSLYLPCLNNLFNLPVGYKTPAFVYPETLFPFFPLVPDFLLEASLFSTIFPANGILIINLLRLLYLFILCGID